MKKPKEGGNQGLFNRIAGVYGWFYGYQLTRYRRILNEQREAFSFKEYDSILDVGCGTGALCQALREEGLAVVGVDEAEQMLAVARKKNPDIEFVQSSGTKGLPFPDHSFDVSIASYVAHGLSPQDRKSLYEEMSRVTRHWVILFDYNQNRSLPTSFVEYLEGGDYFHFIQHGRKEMEECVTELNRCFQQVRVINVDKRAAWYLCKTHENKEVFAGLAGRYEEWFHHHDALFQSELALIRKILPPFERAVDVGCGTGIFTEALGIHEGVEPSTEMAEVAKGRGIRVYPGKGENLPLDTGQYDLVTMITVDCFLEDLHKTLGEIHRVLKPGGVFVMGFLDVSAPLGRIYQEKKEENEFYRWASFHSGEEIRAAMADAGFHVEESGQTVDSFENVLQESKEGLGQGVFGVIRAKKEG